MNKIGIFAISAAVCLAVSAAGCGSKKSSSDTTSETAPASTETKTTEGASTSAGAVTGDITDVIKNDGGLNYYMSKCGKFTFGISDELEIVESDDLDIAFTNGNDSVIGMFSFSGHHLTLKGATNNVIDDYNEKYTNVASYESTVNGVPCFNVTAETTAPDDSETELKIHFSALQYGNGDIIYFTYMGAADSQPQLEEYYQQMLNSIEYLGEPLKTEDETVSNEYYTVTASPMWYIEEKEKTDSVKIGLNLQDNLDDVFYTISLFAPNDKKSSKDAAESLNDTKKGVDSTVSSEIDETKICGYDAFRVTTHTKLGATDFFSETFYVDKDGKCRQISFTYPNGREEEFKNSIQSILESLEIK